MTIKKINKLFKKRPIFVAEISANHGGNINNAKKLIDIAKKNGADAVKLQTYTPRSMTIISRKKYFQINAGLWKGYSLWDLYKKAHTPYEWHKELFKYAKKKNIICFSSAFDEGAVDLLEDLKCPIYKVSSFEMNDYALIKYIAKTKKPVIISTGMSSLEEIKSTYNFSKKAGIKDLTMLYCVSSYPASTKDFNLENISILKEKFNCRIGFSDHSTNNVVSSMAVTLGAEIIEKHIALPNDKTSPDVKFSLKGKEIKKFRADLDLAYLLKGQNKFLRKENEMKNIKFRRSIFSVKNIRKGEKFSKNNIRRIRPGYGISPVYYNKILGKKSKSKINLAEPIKKKYIY